MRTPAFPSRAVLLFIASLGLIASPGLQPAALLAQQRFVTVTGTVTDTSGAVVPGATVDALVAGRTVATTATGADGRYTIALTPATRHQLRARLTGFADETIDLRTAFESASRNFVLRIAAVSDTVVVTAARLAESRATTSASVDVFTARDIAALGSSSLGDIVRMVPALNVESNGREGAVASLFARGGESDYNLVLIDGVRVNQSGGAFDVSRVSGAEIDRVEIVRGAQSSLYGSDAIGSVVQVMTRRAAPVDPPQVLGSIEVGSFDTWRGDARVLGGAARRIDYSLGVTHRGTEGAFQNLLPEHDRFRETTVDGGIGAVLGDVATLRTGLRYATAAGRGVGPISYGSRDTGTVADTTDLSWHVDFTHRISPRVHQQAMFADYRSYRLSGDTIADPTYRVFAILEGTPGALFPDSPRLVRLLDQPAFAAYQSGAQTLAAGQFLATTSSGVGDFVSTTESRFRRPAFKYQADFNWANGQLLSGGYDYERETDPLHPDFLVENHAYFIQQRFTSSDRVFATIGARLDRNSRYGTNVSPKAGAGMFLQPYRSGPLSSAKVFANLGRGIKNPTFGELYGSAFTDGNPGLNPERARTLDAGVEATFASQQFLARATYFSNAYNDQVAFKSSGPGLDGKPDFINIDGSEARGWELEGGLQKPVVGGLTANAGYALVDTKVVASASTSEQFQPGQPLLRRPRHAATLRVTYSRGRGSANFNLRYVGQRHDAAFLGLSAVPSPQFPNGRSVDITLNPAYTLIWLGGEIRLARNGSVFVRIDNASDTTYESALGYPGLPRSVVGGVRLAVSRK
jgi:vitamin B12 transporter